MDKWIKTLLLMMTVFGSGGCSITKPYSGYKMQSYTSKKSLNVIEPAAGDIQNVALNTAPQKSCSFSSFHRKNAIGYEIDDRRQIGFSVSPSIDMFDPSDAEVKVGLNFTMAFGGSANKRPKCTYGSGYYGFLPYAMNDGVNLNGLINSENIKSFAKEKLKEREIRRQMREAKLRI